MSHAAHLPTHDVERAHPSPVGPVAHRGRMIRKDGAHYATYRPENWEWSDWLCDRDENGRLVGKDPMKTSLDVLSASGHPQTRASALVYRLRAMHGVDSGEARDDGFLGLQPCDFPKRLTEVRETVCDVCRCGNKAEIRRCAIFDCPAWQFRMGHNPHNPRRGVRPAAFAGTAPTLEQSGS